MFKAIIQFILDRKKPYLFDLSLRRALPTNASPYVAIQLMRSLMDVYDLKQIDVEVILFLLSKDRYTHRDAIQAEFNYHSTSYVNRVLKRLVTNQHISESKTPCGESEYIVSRMTYPKFSKCLKDYR